MHRSLSIALALLASLALGLPPHAAAQAALNVAFLPKQVTNSYFDVAATGGMLAASELGGQFKQVGPQSATGEQQVPFIEQLTTDSFNF
jgi:rhamnose transport system substrate-binding protein